MRRILIATQGSSCSIEAIQQFTQRFCPKDLTIFILAAIPANLANSRFRAWETEEAMVALDRASATLARAGYTSFSLIRLGDPAESILQVAQDLETDVILLATQARRGIKRMIHSSVAESVLLNAPCRVMVNPFGDPSHGTEGHPAA